MLRTTHRTLLRRTPLRVISQKRFYDDLKKNPHATEKTHTLDVQSDASKRGMKEREESLHSSGTQSKKKDPKKEHPEAPGPIIGMQDERGQSE